jgi:urate oxidase
MYIAPPHAVASAPAEPGYLVHARYGKDKVRVLRVVREGAWHHVVEYTVTALLEGAIETRCVRLSLSRRRLRRRSYTQADNSVVVATDSSVYPFRTCHPR